MPGRPQAAVTPEGVRNGDPVALRGLVERRGRAVLAYCEPVCEPEDAPYATAEAFARFRAAVVAADDPERLSPETLLLGATRHAAAGLARTPSVGGLRGLLRRDEERNECADVPFLIVGRFEGMLAPVEVTELDAHLDACPSCREIEADFARAEQAYRRPPTEPLDEGVMALVLEALASVAPVEGADDHHPGAPDVPVDDPAAGPPQPPADPVDYAVQTPVEPEPFQPTPAEPAPVEPTPVEAFAPEPAAPLGVEEPAPPTVIGGHPDAYHHVDDQPTGVLAPVGDPPLAPAPLQPTRGLPRTRRTMALVPLPVEGNVFRFVLPGAAIAIALLIILAIAGVFGGSGPAPDSAQPALLLGALGL